MLVVKLLQAFGALLPSPLGQRLLAEEALDGLEVVGLLTLCVLRRFHHALDLLLCHLFRGDVPLLVKFSDDVCPQTLRSGLSMVGLTETLQVFLTR